MANTLTTTSPSTERALATLKNLVLPRLIKNKIVTWYNAMSGYVFNTLTVTKLTWHQNEDFEDADYRLSNALQEIFAKEQFQLIGFPLSKQGIQSS